MVIKSRINQPYDSQVNKIVRDVGQLLPNPLSSFDKLDMPHLVYGDCDYGYVGLDGNIYQGHSACHSDITYVDPKNFGYVYNFIYSKRKDLRVHPRFVDWLFSDASPWRNCFKTLVKGEVNGSLMYAISDIDLLTVEVVSFMKAARIYTEHPENYGNFLNKLLDDPLIHPGIAFVFAQLFPPNIDGIHRSYAQWHGSTFDQHFSVDTLNNFMNGTPNTIPPKGYNYHRFVDNRGYGGVNAMWNPTKYISNYETYLKQTYADIIDPKKTVTTRFGCKVDKGGMLNPNTLIALARKESERWL